MYMKTWRILRLVSSLGLIIIVMLSVISAYAEQEKECDKCGGKHYFDCLICKQEDFAIKCLECGWSGNYKQKCTNCNSKGTTICKTCNGKGETKCSGCEGNGFFTCGWCNGSGWIEKNANPLFNAVMPAGRCSNCNGRGKVSCSRCNGKGTVVCVNCSYGYSTCNYCKGSGYERKYNCEVDNKHNKSVVCKYCLSKTHKYACPFCSSEACEMFVYNTIMRNPDEYLGKNVSVVGTVMNVKEEADRMYSISLRNRDGEFYRNFNVKYVKPENGLRVLQGDNITAYGPFISYDTDNTPLIAAYYIELLE